MQVSERPCFAAILALSRRTRALVSTSDKNIETKSIFDFQPAYMRSSISRKWVTDTARLLLPNTLHRKIVERYFCGRLVVEVQIGQLHLLPSASFTFVSPLSSGLDSCFRCGAFRVTALQLKWLRPHSPSNPNWVGQWAAVSRSLRIVAGILDRALRTIAMMVAGSRVDIDSHLCNKSRNAGLCPRFVGGCLSQVPNVL